MLLPLAYPEGIKEKAANGLMRVDGRSPISQRFRKAPPSSPFGYFSRQREKV